MIIYLHLGIHNTELYSMGLHKNKILLTWVFGGKPNERGLWQLSQWMCGLLFLKEKWKVSGVRVFRQFQTKLSRPTSTMQLIFPKLCVHSIFLSPSQLTEENESSGIQPLDFCGALCGSLGNCLFLWSPQAYCKMWRRFLVLKRMVVLQTFAKSGAEFGLCMFLFWLL